MSRHALYSFLVLVKIVENQGHHQHRAQTQQTRDDNYSEMARRLLIWTTSETRSRLKYKKTKKHPASTTCVWLTAHGGRSVVATGVRSSWHFSHMREMPDHINRWNSEVHNQEKVWPSVGSNYEVFENGKRKRKRKQDMKSNFPTWHLKP